MDQLNTTTFTPDREPLQLESSHSIESRLQQSAEAAVRLLLLKQTRPVEWNLY